MRTTKSTLINLIRIINKRTGSDFMLDTYSPGDNPYMYALMEPVGDSGGVRHVNSGGRMKASEMKYYLHGFLDALEREGKA